MRIKSKRVYVSLAALLVAVLCFLFGLVGLSYPTKSVSAESTKTIGRYVDITSAESASTSIFKQYGRQLLPSENSGAKNLRAYVMHVPEDLEGTATITSTSATSTSIKMKENYNRDLRFRVVHYKAAENVNKVIYPLDGSWYKYSYAYTYFMNADGLQEITVSAGDKIYFLVGSFGAGGYRESYLNMSLKIAYGDTTATWKNTNAESSTCNHIGVLAADATTTTSAFYGGTYTYGELLTYEVATVTDILEDTTDFTQAGATEDFTVKGTPTYATDDGNYVTAGAETLTLDTLQGYADSSIAMQFKRPAASTGSFTASFGCDNAYTGGYALTCDGGYTILSSVAADGVLTEIAIAESDYADDAWHTLTVNTLGNRYFVAIDGRLMYAGTQANVFGKTYLRITGTDYSLRDFASTPFDYADEVATAQYDAMLSLCSKAATLTEAEFKHAANYQLVPSAVNEALADLRNAVTVSEVGELAENASKQLDVLYYSKPSVEVLTPENSANFNALTTKDGGGLTTLNGETVYDSNGWHGFSYKEKITNYSWQIEFMSSTTSSDLRIYFKQPSINSAAGYIFRLYQGYMMLYTPGRSGWFTSSNYIFKSSKEYRDGNWHTLTVNLLDDQAFFALDGVRFSPINNMNNSLTAASEYIYTNYVTVENGDGTTSKVATDFEEGYVGIYGQSFYVRNFVVDYFYGEESVADAQFSGLHSIVKEVNAVYRAAEYTTEQKEKALTLGETYRAKVLAGASTEEVSDTMLEFSNELQKAIFDDWVGGMQAGASAFSGGTFTTDENGNSTITSGSSWTTVNYVTKIAQNFRFDLDFNFAVSNGDVRIYFYTNQAKNEGYLLRFYSGMTILYRSPFLATAEYWNNPDVYAVFKSTAINYQDGEDHTLSFNTYKNQFYLTIDEEYITVPAAYNYDEHYVDGVYTNVDESGNAVNYGDMYITLAGTNYTINDFTTTSYSREDTVAAAQFAAIKGITDYLAYTLDKSAYGDNSWDSVLAVAASEVDKIRDCYMDFETTNVDALYAEALRKLWAIDPIIHFSIHEDFEDGEYASNLKVLAGANAIAGTANNKYLTLTDGWNVAASMQRAINYKMSVDFNVADNKIIYFNFNTQEADGSRATGYMIRLFIAGETTTMQLYRGNGTESDATWIWTYANAEKHYRGSNWHNLKVLSGKGKIAIFMDNVLIQPTSIATGMSVSNGILTENSYRYGYFGVQSQSVVSLDNFIYTEVSDFEAELANIKALNEVTGAWYLNETNALGEYWTTENATLNVYNDRVNTLTLDNGSVVLHGNNTVYTPHLAVTFKAIDYTDDSVLHYYIASRNGLGYRLDITSAAVSLYLLNKDGTETQLSTADYNAFTELHTIRIFQSAGTTYVYADATELIAVADTTYYEGGLSITAENLTVDVLKVIVASGVESADIAMIAVAESLAVTLTAELEENQILLGYLVKGGAYDGLYNLAIGDVLEYVDGMVFIPVTATMRMKMGASARIHTDAGLRWTTYIPVEEYEMLTELGATFGTRITSIGSTQHVDIPLVNGLNQGVGEYYWNGALVNIRTGNYERIFLGTGYVSITYADGETVVKYAENNDNYRTYKGVTYAALNDVSMTQTETHKYPVTLRNGQSAYATLPNDTYEDLKTIYAEIEDVLGETVVKTNEWDNDVSMHIIDVCYTNDGDASTEDYTGNALAVLIEYQDQVILIDAGTDTESSVIRVLNFLEEEGVQRIDHLILTHQHSDHAGGMPAVIEQFDVGTFYSRPQNSPSSYYVNVETALCNKVNSDGTTVQFVYPNKEGWKVSLSDDTYFEFYNCTKIFEMQDKYTDGNYFSLEILFVSGEATAFFGGDAVGLTQNQGMLEVFPQYDGIDVYQVQHHGTGGSYSPKELVDALKPTYTIVPTSGTPADIVYAYSEPYGRTYVTGYVGTSSFDIGESGQFVMRADATDRWSDKEQVSIESTTMEYNGTNRAYGANIIADRGVYIVPAYGVATAVVYTVPENVKEPTVITLRGSDIYRKAEGSGNIRFRLILNDRVLYTGDCSTANVNLNVSLRFTAQAGDKIYFAVDCTTTENSNTAVYMTSAIYIDGLYVDASKCNHINSANDSTVCGKNFYNGALYNGGYYTYGDILSYEALIITEAE